MAATTQTVYEALNRENKVNALVILFRSIKARSYGVAHLSEKAWGMAAVAANVRIPSSVTRNEVCTRLKQLEVADRSAS